MNQLNKKIDFCREGREQTAKIIADTLAASNNLSESEIRDKLQHALAAEPQFFDTGWYAPPPAGIGMLLANTDDISRLQFDSLRNKYYWPNPDYTLDRESIGLVYLSPVHKQSGIIGDIGLTFYRGENTEIQEHIKSCLDAIETAAEQAEVGMEFRELHRLAQEIFRENGLQSGIVAQHDKTGNNFGHTVPWSYEVPTKEEFIAIQKGGMDKLKDVIGNKRLYVNGVETFKIPETIAFTLESRLVSTESPSMPDVFIHVIITFKEGKRQIISCYNPIFEKLGMDYIKSRF